MKWSISSGFITFGLLLLVAASAMAQDLERILVDIGELEGNRDPKCYATSSRLENFMYGTPLTGNARFQKNLLQKRLAELVWRLAGHGAAVVTAEAIAEAFGEVITFDSSAEGDYLLTFPSNIQLKVLANDIRQYGSVAYSLRAILGVQQDALINLEAEPLPSLADDAIEALKQRLDVATLALLQEADAYARAHDEYEISLSNINRSWLALFETSPGGGSETAQTKTQFSDAKPPLLSKLIQTKVASYEKYNNISNQLLVRNMQVYFARLSWPTDEVEQGAFRKGFIQAVVGYAIELYKGAMNVAKANNHSLIREADVARFVEHFTPHKLNEYEDVIFFPNLPDGRVVIEAYDLDSFRDSGIHWLYLGLALDSGEITQFLDSDPFAAELLAENISQFGVLLLREAGMEGARQDRERLSLDLLSAAVEHIQAKVDATVAGQNTGVFPPTQLHSNPDDLPDSQATAAWFSDVTQGSGIDAMHRSSDWLSRQLRSYLKRDESTGVITIPPAFGGSGVAAGDIDNDGHPDILVLSGLGNKLYRNNQDGTFTDVTEEAGVVFKRPADGLPGEPRQPLIADLDNDGWQDIVITYVADQHQVYRNLGGGIFENVSATANLGGEGLIGGPATVFDFDGDGMLDIYITYFGDYLKGVLPTLSRINRNGLPNSLFRNTGDFTFEAVEAGVADRGWGQAVTHTDFNKDNLQDLIVGNDFGTNVYFQNTGDGTFIDVTDALGTGKPSYTMGIGLADLNNDEFPDIYVSNIVTMNKDEKYVLPNEDTRMKFNLEKLANMRVVEANDLFLSSPHPESAVIYSLSRELVGRGYNSTGWAWGASFFDADQDGDDDLYVLNGMNEFNLYSSKNSYAEPGVQSAESHYLPVDTRESNVFFINGAGKLNNMSEQSGLNLLANSRSAAYLDYDNDGDLDILVNNYHERAYLFRNQSERLNANWIKLRLKGNPASGVNLDAIGAKVIIERPDGLKVWREIHGSEGYMTVHERVVHAGLGAAKTASIRITWPNGQVQVIQDLAANTTHTIVMDNVDDT